ncbi:MAG: hypothetical protein KAJ88_04415 [Candidatus Aenigmarchaeota archaeon]|nr:hypothetical protein [Candidatus Aenigmarchaeota archaeon]
MNIKEFLKPDKIKIALFIILIIIASIICVISLASVKMTSDDPRSVCCDEYGCIYIINWLPTKLFLPLTLAFYDCTFLIPFLINLPYLYLLSCIIVAPFRLIRKNTSKTKDTAA